MTSVFTEPRQSATFAVCSLLPAHMHVKMLRNPAMHGFQVYQVSLIPYPDNGTVIHIPVKKIILLKNTVNKLLK